MFEKYLEEVFAEDYHGTDDDMPDAFDNWLAELEQDELIAYANQAMASMKK